MSRVEGALKAEGLPPLAWYEVLAELERAGGLRPFALEEACACRSTACRGSWPAWRRRASSCAEAAPRTAAARWSTLTEAGRAMLGRMERVHAGAVQEAVGARLSPEEAERLADLLGRLIAPPEAPTAPR